MLCFPAWFKDWMMKANSWHEVCGITENKINEKLHYGWLRGKIGTIGKVYKTAIYTYI